MPDLRNKTIRLAHEDKSLRPHLLPLLAKKAGDRLTETAQDVADTMMDLDAMVSRDSRVSNKTKGLMKKFNKAGYEFVSSLMDDTGQDIRL